MKTAIIKKEVEAMCKKLSTITGVNYKLDYAPHFGGYEMYFTPEGETSHSYGRYGVCYRKSASEMHSYLQGVIEAITNNNKCFQVAKEDSRVVVTLNSTQTQVGVFETINDALIGIGNYAKYNRMGTYTINVNDETDETND